MLGEPADQYNLRKSKYWMRRADILVFVFFPGVDNASVGIELQYAVDNVPGSTWRTILALLRESPFANIRFGKRCGGVFRGKFFKGKRTT